MKKFPLFQSKIPMSCGASCLYMIAKYHGIKCTFNKIISLSKITEKGTSLHRISQAAEEIGFSTSGIKISFEQLIALSPFPCIAHCNKNHFVVIYNIQNGQTYIADPSQGLNNYNNNDFVKWWALESNKGIILLFEKNKK